MSPMTEQEARGRVAKLRALYKNLASFVAINIVLVAINLITSPNDLWFYWVTIFWGLALALQAGKLFIGTDRLFDKNWEERKIRKLTGQQKSKK
ncbi:MAG: 2TM domain-containing protein [Deltaproteobacteria bacterium]|nr:2TM domain-containing protein [Deltaproteobacteria bacterium]